MDAPSIQQASWRVLNLQTGDAQGLEGLLEPGVDAMPVRIRIVQDDVETGWDDGALGFERDAVWFSGRASSFRIVAPDLIPGAYRLSGTEAVTDGEARSQGLPLRHPTREVWMRIEVRVVNERREWDDEARLVEEIKRLRALVSGEGPSQYPPLAPRPGTIRKSSTPEQKRRWQWTGTTLILLGVPPMLWVSAFERIGSLFMVTGMWILLFIRTDDPKGDTLRRIDEEEAA